MNGSSESTGLEPADASHPDHSPGRRSGGDAVRILTAAAAICLAHHEHAASQAIEDALCRIRAQAGSSGEGERGREGVHGEDSPEAEAQEVMFEGPHDNPYLAN